MTDATSGKVQISNYARYKSTQSLDYTSVPWRLYIKATKLFWDPETLEYEKDAETWAKMSERKRLITGFGVAGLMLGEEAVTYDILPLLRCMSDLGRLEDTMYLTTFALEESRHTHFMRRWLDVVGFGDQMTGMLEQMRQAQTAQGNGSGNGALGGAGGVGGVNNGGILDSRLTEIMQRLDTDHSPEAILDATIVYNQLVEGVGALSAFMRFKRTFEIMSELGGLPALEKGMRLVARDERRHIAYGTYLGRKLIAENPGLWDYFEKRWAELTEVYSAARLQEDQTTPGVFRFTEEDLKMRDTFVSRRYEVIAVARNMRPDEVEHSAVEAFEPDTELDPVPA